MDWFYSLITNPFIVVALSSWAIAQFLKAVINLCVTKKWNFERLFGDGGMPSGHSATVCSLATFCALSCGPSSVEFALALIFAVVVCHDATGVRQEAGKHALLIDQIINTFDEIYREKIPEVKLKMFVGHTFLQVFCGGVIGICNALIFYYLIF